MTRPKYPPLPTINRPRFRLIRTLGVAIALAALAVAWLAARAGRWDMVATVLVMGGGFGALPWIHPLSPWFLLVQAGAGLATGWLAFQLTGRLWVALVLTTPLLIGLLSRPLARRRLSSLDPDNVQIGAPDLVMENAEGFQEEFLANGFTSVGAVTFLIRGTTVISSLLISPDSRAYASVTDAILNVTSVFPSGQVLVTRNNDVSPLPAYVLTNGLSGATPGELIVGHVEALALLAAHDHHPILLAADEIPRRAMDSGREGIIWLKHQTDLKMKAGHRGPLLDRKNLPELIDSWESVSSDANQDGNGSTT